MMTPDPVFLSDGTHTCTWDTENRLLTQRKSDVEIQNTYDAQHRRVRRTVHRLTHPEPGTENRERVTDTAFIYEAWNVIAELDLTPRLPLSTSPVLRSYLWGLDLSGSLQGAGGVGGLLSVTNHRSTTANNAQPSPTVFPLFDGNGNITAYGDARGNLTATFTYDAFGNTIQSDIKQPELAALCRYGFSTKPVEPVTGWLYYGYRYYAPEVGRWPSRDPIGERGGRNMYAITHNNLPERWDVRGLSEQRPVVSCAGTCGASIDDWISDELSAVLGGWDNYAAEYEESWQRSGRIDTSRTPSLAAFFDWIYANADYKNPDKFAFNKGVESQCGISDPARPGLPGCTQSVTLCGKCVKKSVLGNIMYGLVGTYAGFTDSDLESIQNNKWIGSFLGAVFDPNDSNAYDIGQGAAPALTGLDTQGAWQRPTIPTICAALNSQAGFQGGWGLNIKLDGTRDSSTANCAACAHATTETQHSGNYPPGINGLVTNPR